MANIIPSGYAGFDTLISIANIPIKKPTIYFPVFVCAAVTGSVAINTAPKAKPPKIKCKCAGNNINSLTPQRLNNKLIIYPPIKTDSIVFHEPIPVKIKIAAPINIAIVEVSPTEPGIVPLKKELIKLISTGILAAKSAKGVAPEKPSITVPLSVFTQTLSPDIKEG
jgi:hypothetical protein